MEDKNLFSSEKKLRSPGKNFTVSRNPKAEDAVEPTIDQLFACMPPDSHASSSEHVVSAHDSSFDRES